MPSRPNDLKRSKLLRHVVKSFLEKHSPRYLDKVRGLKTQVLENKAKINLSSFRFDVTPLHCIAIVHLWWYYSWFSTGRPWQPIWPNCEGQIAGLQTHRRISISRKYGLTIQKKNQHLWRRGPGHHGRLLIYNGFDKNKNVFSKLLWCSNF